MVQEQCAHTFVIKWPVLDGFTASRVPCHPRTHSDELTHAREERLPRRWHATTQQCTDSGSRTHAPCWSSKQSASSRTHTDVATPHHPNPSACHTRDRCRLLCGFCHALSIECQRHVLRPEPTDHQHQLPRASGHVNLVCPTSTKNASGTSSGALGRRDFVYPEFIAMLNDADGPCWSYESRAGL